MNGRRYITQAAAATIVLTAAAFVRGKRPAPRPQPITRHYATWAAWAADHGVTLREPPAVGREWHG